MQQPGQKNEHADECSYRIRGADITKKGLEFPYRDPHSYTNKWEHKTEYEAVGVEAQDGILIIKVASTILQ